MNDIWTSVTETLDYYGEFLKKLNSKSYLLVIESYLLKSMASVNMDLTNKYKVVFFQPFTTKYVICILFLLVLICMFKEPFLEVFIKEGIACKLRPEQELIRQCSFTVKLVSYDEFKSKLLPPILKSMLRNPEVILECIATVISSVSLDLSPNANEITKGFSGKIFIKFYLSFLNFEWSKESIGI